MAFVVAALEVSDKIQTVGAFAGFAAILGLAVLSVLYFGQAREIKRLREWAGRAPERAAEMQDRVSTDASRRVVAQPIAPARPAATQPATAGAAAAAAGGAAAAAKTAPAPMPGVAAKTPPPVGAPTLAGRTEPVPGEATEVKPGEAAKPAADGTDQPTVLQPSVGDGAASAGAAAASGAPAAPAGGAAASGAAAAPAGGAAPGGAPAAPAGGAAPSGTPAAPAGGAAPSGAPAAPPASGTPAAPAGGTPGAASPPPSAPATPAGGRAPAPAARPEAAVPLRSTRAAREAPAASEAAASSSSSPAGATIAIVAAVGAIVVAVVLVVTGVIGGGDEPATKRNVIVPTAPEPGTPTTGSSTATPLNRAKVSVVVLNGTVVGGLAAEASGKLGDNGYQLAAQGNRGDATVPKTLVLYAPGQARAARDVRKVLRVGTLGELDAGTEVVAQNFVKPAGAKPDVVVTLGADAAQP
jgi:hypothetical protein